MCLLDKLNWMCSEYLNVLPFNNIVDNDMFIKCATNYDYLISRLNCDNLLVNPFDLTSEKQL